MNQKNKLYGIEETSALSEIRLTNNDTPEP
jgi:hypothetical protein